MMNHLSVLCVVLHRCWDAAVLLRLLDVKQVEAQWFSFVSNAQRSRLPSLLGTCEMTNSSPAAHRLFLPKATIGKLNDGYHQPTGPSFRLRLLSVEMTDMPLPRDSPCRMDQQS